MTLPPAPTLRCDVTREHAWLQHSDERVALYNDADCLATALARRRLPALVEASGNSAYWAWWWGKVVPAALNVQRRGFGCVDRAELARLQREVAGELDEIDAKLRGACGALAEMGVAAQRWLAEHQARDLAAALAKNAKRKRPRPESEVQCTRAAQREIGYRARVRAVAEARASLLASPQARARWLFDELGLEPAPPTHKRTARSTDKHALIHVWRHLRKRDEPHRWIVEDLFHRAQLNTLLTRYLGRDAESCPIPIGPDERLFYHLRTYAAETLRWAASDPPLDQWPARIRSIVRARPGHTFVSADWKQLEVRILAYYAGEAADIAALEDPTRDVHAETVWDLFPEMAPPTWATLPPERKALARAFAKNKRYELNYGGSGLGSAARVFCPCPRPQCRAESPASMQLAPEEQRAIMARWEASRPRTWAWRRALYEQVVRDGKRWRCPVSGYTRTFLRPARDIRTELANYPMQHTAAELLNRAVVELDAMGAPIAKTIHDQIVLEVPLGTEHEWSDRLRAVMERPVSELGGARFPVDIHTGERWSDLK